jgi:hypothetical protein
MGIRGGTAHHRQMELMTMRVEDRRGGGSVVGGTILGATLVLGGLLVAYLAFRTPFLAVLTYALRPGATPPDGTLTILLLMALPLSFLAVGTDRLARVVAGIRARHRRRDWIDLLPAGIVASRTVDLGDGRAAPTLVAGHFGLAVVREVADATADEVEGAIRDTDRIRRWLTRHEQDFVVRLYTAVAAPDHDLVRTPACALVTPEQLPSWLALLPNQRSLTTSRRDRLVRMLEGVDAAW